MSNELMNLENSIGEDYSNKSVDNPTLEINYNNIMSDNNIINNQSDEDFERIRNQTQVRDEITAKFQQESDYQESNQFEKDTNNIHYFIPSNILSSLSNPDSTVYENGNSELIDDDDVSAVASAATFGDSMSTKRGNEQIFNMDEYPAKKPQLFPADELFDTNDTKLTHTTPPTIHTDSRSAPTTADSQDSNYIDNSLSTSSRNGTVEPQKSKVIKFTPNRTSQNIKKPHLLLTNPNTKKTKRDNKGPPKNSRFFKVYNPDGSKNQKPSSIHHYNPYRYPQNRSKLNPYPDFIRNRKDENGTTKSTTSSGVSITATGNATVHEPLNSIGDDPKLKLPELRPTIDEFEDIYAYIESIRELGEKYGAVKIIPPKEFVPKFAINLESFWIKSNRQLWKSPSDEINSRCEFYRQLRAWLTKKGTSLNKLPCIDKRAIDLYRLFRVVNLRGGFLNCCNDKLWAQIGRELGFYGKISSSLSSSIKSVYQKYLLHWEQDYESSGQDFLNSIRNDEKYSLFSKEEYIEKCPTVSNILGSSTNFVRNRQILADAGFPTYYDQATTQKRGITMSDSTTLPGYDFYDWYGGKCSEDTNPTELKISSLYTLKQFYDKSRILKNQILNKINEYEHFKFENLNYLDNVFWKLLGNRDIMFETEVALRQPTTIHDSGYENRFISDKNGNLSDSILGSLNFNNSTILNDSMLQFTDPYTNVIHHSTLNFFMFYGSQAWTMEDHWMYNIDYQYLGDAKSIYVIPPEYQEKYENLVKLQLEARQVAERTSKTLLAFETTIMNYDIFNACLENQVCYDAGLQRSGLNDKKFSSFMEGRKVPPKFNNDMMFSPSFLKENGIDVYHTFQEVGEMIIKFPKTYSSYFSLGTCVNESVNITTHDWIKHSLDARKWLQEQELTPQFSTFAMLLTAAYESDDFKILKSLEPTLKRGVDSELKRRKQTREHMKEVNLNGTYDFKSQLQQLRLETEALSSDTRKGTIGYKLSEKLRSLNFVTDIDVADMFPTFVIVTPTGSKSSNVTMSLEYFLKEIETNSKRFIDFDCEMVSLVSDEYLEESAMLVESKLKSPELWLGKYHELLSNHSRPPLPKAVRLLDEGRAALEDKNSPFDKESETFKVAVGEYRTLKRYSDRTASWRKKALLFLKRSNIRLPFVEFQELVNEIKKLIVSTDEIKDILLLATKISVFDETVAQELTKEVEYYDYEKLQALYEESLGINIELNTSTMLSKIMKRRSWLNNLSSKEIKSYKELLDVYEEGASLKLTNVNDLQKLEMLKDKVDRCETITQRFNILKQDTEKVLYSQLIEIDETCIDLPLPDVKRYVRNLINEHKHITEIIIPLIEKIKEKVRVMSTMKDDFSHRLNTFCEFNDTIGKQLHSISIELTLKTLCKFKEFEAESLLFKEQLIDGPLKVNNLIDGIFKNLINSYKEIKWLNSSSNELGALESLIVHDTDVLGSGKERYCICRQTHEGNMVECETCQQWFHFGCIGYPEKAADSISANINEDNMKFVCPLCDVEEKLPNTKQFNLHIATKPTFENLIQQSNEIIQYSCTIAAHESLFLKVTDRYSQLYKQILSTSSITEEKDTNGETVYKVHQDDPVSVRDLLQKLNGCIVNFEGLRQTLHQRYKKLAKPSDQVAVVEPTPPHV